MLAGRQLSNLFSRPHHHQLRPHHHCTRDHANAAPLTVKKGVPAEPGEGLGALDEPEAPPGREGLDPPAAPAGG